MLNLPFDQTPITDEIAQERFGLVWKTKDKKYAIAGIVNGRHYISSQHQSKKVAVKAAQKAGYELAGVCGAVTVVVRSIIKGE